MNLTDKKLRSIESPEKGRRLVFDDHREAPKGFGVRVTAAGKRAFVLRYRSRQGHDRLLTIGDYPTWSLAAARKRATDLRREIDNGADILEQRREERAEPTVADVAKRFLKHKQRLASHGEIEAALRLHVLPHLGDKKLRDVRRREVIAVIERMAESRPRQAGLTLGYLKNLFAFAEDREIIEASPIATLTANKVAQGLTAGKRDRVLSHDEIKALWTLTDPPQGMHRATLLALKMILVTGQRPGEVAGMRWDELSGSVWTIPSERRGKTGDTHTVPLTATAQALLEDARALGGREHVFSARGGPIDRTAVAKAALRCAKALGMAEPRWRPHDLRRTMRTGLAAAGVSETVAEAVIGHVRQGIVGVYDRHRYDQEKRAALEAWERCLLRIVGADSGTGNVVSITTAAP